MSNNYLDFQTAEQWAESALEDICVAQDLAATVEDYGNQRIVNCEYFLEQAIEKILKAENIFENGDPNLNNIHSISLLLEAIQDNEFINSVPQLIFDYPQTISDWLYATQYSQESPISSITDLFVVVEDLEKWIRNTMQKYW